MRPKCRSLTTVKGSLHFQGRKQQEDFHLRGEKRPAPQLVLPGSPLPSGSRPTPRGRRLSCPENKFQRGPRASGSLAGRTRQAPARLTPMTPGPPRAAPAQCTRAWLSLVLVHPTPPALWTPRPAWHRARAQRCSDTVKRMTSYHDLCREGHQDMSVR